MTNTRTKDEMAFISPPWKYCEMALGHQMTPLEINNYCHITQPPMVKNESITIL